jgi:uncharacterized membrane protein YtjA (UPF0391 family)
MWGPLLLFVLLTVVVALLALGGVTGSLAGVAKALLVVFVVLAAATGLACAGRSSL